MVTAKSTGLRRQMNKDVKGSITSLTGSLGKVAGREVASVASMFSREEAEYNKLLSHFRSSLDPNQKNIFAAAQLKQAVVYDSNSSQMNKITARAAMISLRSKLRSTLNPLQSANFTNLNAMNKSILRKRTKLAKKSAVYGAIAGESINKSIGRSIAGKRTMNVHSW